MAPWLTVVTIVKDDPVGLQQTIDSLAAGDLSGVEHVIVDGSHKALEFRNATNASVIHQPPQGIYSAMNAGLDRALGQYVWFLNAGDLVVDDQVLARVQREMRGALWAFAPVIIESVRGKLTETPLWDFETERRHHFARGHFPSHQGTFVLSETARSLGGFDTSFSICADYAMCLRLVEVSKPKELTFPVARFREGGASTVHWRASVQEFHRARREILAPTGVSSLLERLHTARQYILLGAYRTLVRK